MTNVLTASQITITRGHHRLISGLDLSLPSGSVTTLTGPNGSGKSTLAWCLGLYDERFTGNVTLLGRKHVDLRPRSIRALHRDSVALQTQDLLYEESWKVSDLLRHAAWALKIPRSTRESRIAEALERCDASSLLNTRVEHLSGGEQQRVALAKTLLIARPRLIILDEPTAGADANLTALVLECINEWTDHGTSVLAVSHDEKVVTRSDQRIDLRDRNDL